VCPVISPPLIILFFQQLESDFSAMATSFQKTLQNSTKSNFLKELIELYKIEPLDGTNYKRWSQKLLLCFEQLVIDYVLFSEYLDEGNTT